MVGRILKSPSPKIKRGHSNPRSCEYVTFPADESQGCSWDSVCYRVCETDAEDREPGTWRRDKDPSCHCQGRQGPRAPRCPHSRDAAESEGQRERVGCTRLSGWRWLRERAAEPTGGRRGPWPRADLRPCSRLARCRALGKGTGGWRPVLAAASVTFPQVPVCLSAVTVPGDVSDLFVPSAAVGI